MKMPIVEYKSQGGTEGSTVDQGDIHIHMYVYLNAPDQTRREWDGQGGKGVMGMRTSSC